MSFLTFYDRYLEIKNSRLNIPNLDGKTIDDFPDIKAKFRSHDENWNEPSKAGRLTYYDLEILRNLHKK